MENYKYHWVILHPWLWYNYIRCPDNLTRWREVIQKAGKAAISSHVTDLSSCHTYTSTLKWLPRSKIFAGNIHMQLERFNNIFGQRSSENWLEYTLIVRGKSQHITCTATLKNHVNQILEPIFPIQFLPEWMGKLIGKTVSFWEHYEISCI